MRPLFFPRAWRPTLAVVLTLLGTGVAGVGCGEDEGRPIPSRSARDLVARFDEVERRVDSKACNDVRDDSLPALQQEIEDLPSNVDANVRTTLEDGLGRLTELVEAECVEPPDPAPEVTTPEPGPEPQYDSNPTPEPDPSPAPNEPDTGGGGGGGGGGNGNDGGGSGSGNDGSGNGGGDDGGGGSGDDSGGGGGDDDGGGSGSLPPADGGGANPTGGTPDSGAAGATSADASREPRA